MSEYTAETTWRMIVSAMEKFLSERKRVSGKRENLSLREEEGK